MNKIIIIVEPMEFLIKRFNNIAIDEQDTIYYITNKKELQKYKNILKFDIRKDYIELREFIKNEFKPNAIITTNESYMLETAKLANEFGVLKNSLKSILYNRDKKRMKQIWNVAEIKTPKAKFYSGLDKLKIDKYLEFPLIIKPSQGYGSCGVMKVNNKEELIDQAKKILMFNALFINKEKLSHNGILVEEYINGEEYSIDTIWFKGRPIKSFIMAKGNATGPFFPDRLYIIDTQMEDSIRIKIENLSYKAVKATKLRNGASHSEVRFKEGIPYMIESTARPGGGGYVYSIFEKSYNIDVFKLFYYASTLNTEDEIESAMRYLKIDTNCNPKKMIFEYFVPYKGQGKIDYIAGEDKLKRREEVLDYLIFKKSGDVLYEENINPTYFCWIVAECKKGQKISEIYNTVKEYDNIFKITYK